jgi:glycosyltransferase involved in cell wall biosynthesis
MSETVLFCGPIPLPDAIPVGGYEACNRRTIAALRGAGVQVRELHYPQPRGGKLAKLYGYVRGYLDLLTQIGQTPGQLFHLTGLYKHFALGELLLMRAARRHGLRTIYDVRAGSMHKHYARLGPLYRWLFRRLLRSADLVMIEGTDYAPFVQQVTGAAPFYLPNHIEAAGMPARAPLDEAPLRLIYVGRVTLEKGVELALQSTRLLQQRGLDCTMAVAGPADAALLARLQADYRDCPVQWLGSLPAADVLQRLGHSHLFLFPTRHPGEGHSNALTEAMAMGCVPVAADNGFNRSVIGPAGVVLPLTADASAYADAIETLWRQRRWPALSQAAMARTQTLFSTEQAVARLGAAYRELLKGRP